MSTDLKQDILNAVRKGNCPFRKMETHACWGCPHSTYEDNTYICHNSRYDKKSYKVKPRKVKRTAFCEHCGKKVQFYLNWMGCVWPTDKGIVAYRELEAHCPHCYREIYVPAINDVNVARRNKAYAEKVPDESIKIGTMEDLIKMCEECEI